MVTTLMSIQLLSILHLTIATVVPFDESAFVEIGFHRYSIVEEVRVLCFTIL